MTITDEEAREVIEELKERGYCVCCDGIGTVDGDRGDGGMLEDEIKCPNCDGDKYTGRAFRLITLLESRIGT